MILVVAAVAEREGRYLVALRPEGRRHGTLWEFPGGKVRDGETAAGALARELREELGVRVAEVGAPLLVAPDPGSDFRIEFVPVTLLGEPRALEHADLRWAAPAELETLALAPADRRFAREVLARAPAPRAAESRPADDHPEDPSPV